MESAASSFSIDSPATRSGFWKSLVQRIAGASSPGLSLEGSALALRYADENRDVTLKNARIGAWIVILLVPACSILDFFVYREQFLQFLALRLTCSLCCLPLLFGINRAVGRRHYGLYPILLPVIPAIFISLMIYLSGDASSVYYAGLTLCIVGTSFVFNWTFREIGLTLAIILSVYLAATLPNLHVGDPAQKWGIFFNNTSFILLNCVILFASSVHHHAIRRREFLTRCTVEDQREELKVRNQELTDALRMLRETEAQLIQREKIASLDRLSAGIIHEINNPLNFAKSALFVLRKKARHVAADQQDTLARIIQDVGEGIDRVASIVSDLRSFSHPDVHLAALEVAGTVKKAVRMLRQKIDEQEIILDAGIPADLVVHGDENHLIQIIINLVQNSIAALKDRPDPRIQISSCRTSSRVELAVHDNGTGIKPEHLHRIFDPFFTTKDVGEGMGMGLNICYRMMKQMGGGIDVESHPDVFTKFTLWLPVEEHSNLEPAEA
jgi:two-component system, sensor histidine kinase PhcS